MSTEHDAHDWNERAKEEITSGEPERAVEYARRAHELARRNPIYLNTLGVAHAENGDMAQALVYLRRAVKLKPDFVHAIVNLAKVLEKEDDRDAAQKAYEHAYQLSPSYPTLAPALARVYRERGFAERARALLVTAPGIDPQALAIATAACTFDLEGEGAAIAQMRAAVDAHPDWKTARTSLGHLLLATGHWRDGWRFYRDSPLRDLPRDRIALRGEQGIGDVLFFLRFVPALGRKVSLACDRKLHSILTPGNLLDEIREPGDEGILIGDLPLLLGSEDTPPAWPLEARAKADLRQYGPPPYLGVTWRAGTDLGRRREYGSDPGVLMKAVPPALLGAALRGRPGTVIVLQRGARTNDVAQFASAFKGRFEDLSALGDDLPALLGVLAALDDYVGVSNANVHFLAGLGRSARVLIPYPGEWRWMRRPGPSPWFPGFAVYRQPRNRDWSAPLAELRRDLVGNP
jgi:tetratricopeptide (TPR) repeat protein